MRVILVSFVLATSSLALAASPAAKAELRDASGKIVGTALLTEVAGGVRVKVDVSDLAPGKHGIHLHGAGKCEGPDFKTAGGHFNPSAKQHGLENPAGHHGGDLPNLEVGKNGKGSATFTAKGVSLGEGPESLLGKDGTALVLHAAADDGKSDPAGNSGARIACGVVTKE